MEAEGGKWNEEKIETPFCPFLCAEIQGTPFSFNNKGLYFTACPSTNKYFLTKHPDLLKRFLLSRFFCCQSVLNREVPPKIGL